MVNYGRGQLTYNSSKWVGHMTISVNAGSILQHINQFKQITELVYKG